MMQTLEPGSEIDGFRVGEVIHVGTMATIYRLMGIDTNTDVRIRPFIGDAAPIAELV